jgi:hypothetical protein
MLLRSKRFWLPFVIACLLIPGLLLLGAWSTGGGHGNYIFALVCFPYAWIVSKALPMWAMWPVDLVLMPVTILQFPAYGALTGIYWYKRKLRSFFPILLVVHILTAVIAVLLMVRIGE